jgi:uncharacterized protein (TIGR02145 family)
VNAFDSATIFSEQRLLVWFYFIFLAIKEVSMKIKRAIFMLLALITICPAQTINISGVVKMSGGSGLEGVKVRLGKADIGTTTASDGSFTLKDGTGLRHQPNQTGFSSDCPFFLENSRLFFSVVEQAEITVMAYGCNGKLLLSYGKAVSGGNYSITLPHLGSGIQIYRVSINKKLYTFKSVNEIAANRSPASSWMEIGLAKQAKAAARIDDALMFIKQGYQYYRLAVTKPDTSGLQITMTPLDTGTITDVEGNVYKTVRIGNQYWTAENLRTTKYNDGSSIGSACYFYKNTTDAAAKKKWGALYMDAAANSGKLAPTGWHVPTGADWDTLVNYLISRGYNYDGTTKKDFTAKSLAAATDWATSTDSGAIGNDLSLNNASGFSALPAGWKFFEFEKQTTGAYWWIAGGGAANVCDLWWIFRSLDRYSTINFGASVRLVRRV